MKNNNIHKSKVKLINNGIYLAQWSELTEIYVDKTKSSFNVRWKAT